MDESLTDEIGFTVAARVVGVAHGVGITLAAPRTEHFDRVTNLGEHMVRVREFAPPESDRPAGARGHRRVGDDHGNALLGLWVENFGVFQAQSVLQIER